MPQAVRIEGGAAEQTLSSRSMKHGLAYIVVADEAGNGWQPGEVVFRAGSSVANPKYQTHSGLSDSLKVRDLRPGEKVLMEGT